jgi:hypothetical protein
MNEIKNIIKNIKENPHWRIIIRPEKFEQERITNLIECWNIMESCKLSLTGWDYPHVDRQNRFEEEEWIESWCDFAGFYEYWKFFQSGQFLHIFTLWENTSEDKKAFDNVKDKMISVPDHFKPTGFIGAIRTLFTITEIYEFATRLAQKGIFNDSLYIIIQANNIKNSILRVRDWDVHLQSFYPFYKKTFSKESKIKTEELISNSSNLAIETTIEFLKKFGWIPTFQLLKDEQKKILRNKF